MSHQSLTKKGYVLKKKYLDKKQQRQIHKDLTFKQKVIPSFQALARPKPFSTYLESELRYYLPKFYALQKFGPPKKDNLDIDVQPTNFDVHWDLLDHQQTAWKKLEQQFGPDGPKGGVLSLPCGYGKSFLAIKLVSWLKGKGLVIVNKDILMKQWKKAIESCSNARVGIIQQDKIDVEDKDIVLGMLHSVSMKDYPEELFSEFSCVIVDEAHHISSETFSKALPKITCKYTLGLSATPIRKDGLTQVFLNYLGPIFHVEKRTGQNTVHVKIVEVQSNSEHFQLEMMEATGTKDTGKMTTNISQYEVCNYLVLEIVRILIASAPRQILILGARRDQLEWLNEKCQEAGFKTSNHKYASSGLYYGNKGMNKATYWKMMEESAKCDIIWGTNEIAKEGLDIPTLNTLILLSGGSDVEQAVGRILRKFHKDTPPVVIDMVYKCGNFPRHNKTRRDYYEYEGYYMNKHIVKIEDDVEVIPELTPGLEKFLTNYPETSDKRLLSRKKKNNPNLDFDDMDDLNDAAVRIDSIAVLDPSVRLKTTLNITKKKKPEPLKCYDYNTLVGSDGEDSEEHAKRIRREGRPGGGSSGGLVSKEEREALRKKKESAENSIDNISNGSNGSSGSSGSDDYDTEAKPPKYIPIQRSHLKLDQTQIDGRGGATVTSCLPPKKKTGTGASSSGGVTVTSCAPVKRGGSTSTSFTPMPAVRKRNTRY